MSSKRASKFVLLVCAVLFSCVGYGQSMHAQELEAYRLNLLEQVNTGKLTGNEAESLYMQKQDQVNRQVDADNARVNPSPREPVRSGSGNPALICQTYPDGRTECR